MNTVWNDLRALQRIPWPDRALSYARSLGKAKLLESPIFALSNSDSVANLLPGATCLPRALAARSLLGDVPSTLRVGFVRRGETLRGHAWLTVGERVVVGDDGSLERYTPIALRVFPEESRGLRS